MAAITKQQLEVKLKKLEEAVKWWWVRERAAAWNDDGKGGHIDAMVMIKKREAQIEVVKELIAECK